MRVPYAGGLTIDIDRWSAALGDIESVLEHAHGHPNTYEIKWLKLQYGCSFAVYTMMPREQRLKVQHRLDAVRQQIEEVAAV